MANSHIRPALAMTRYNERNSPCTISVLKRQNASPANYSTRADGQAAIRDFSGIAKRNAKESKFNRQAEKVLETLSRRDSRNIESVSAARAYSDIEKLQGMARHNEIYRRAFIFDRAWPKCVGRRGDLDGHPQKIQIKESITI